MNPLLRTLLLIAASGGYPPRIWSLFEREGLSPEAYVQKGPDLWKRIECTEQVTETMERLL